METYGYLYAYFTWDEAMHDDQRVFMAISRDGLHYEPLNGGEAVLSSGVGTGCVRDPHLFRNQINGKYYVIATDLDMASRNNYFPTMEQITKGVSFGPKEYAAAWTDFLNNGSRGIVVWESEDLLHWSEGELVSVVDESVGSVWAPKVCYDPGSDEYVMAFSGVPGGTPNLSVFCTRTRDFHSFGKVEPLIPAVPNVHGERVFESEPLRDYVQFIDSTTIRVDDWYYRFTKRETLCVIQCERSRHITGGFEMLNPVVAGERGVEGPCCYPIENGARYVLLMDGFMLSNAGVGYFPSVATKEELARGEFRRLPPEEYSLPRGCKHGSVFPLTQDEYVRLMGETRMR